MKVQICYENERIIEESDLGIPLLQISLKHGIPHQHACGGRARCSTCRVRILENPENLSPRNAAEQKLADRKQFDDTIRLACQTRIRGPVRLQRLVLDEQDVGLAMAVDSSDARLRKAAVMFSDLRNFTAFSEAYLPYDTVHILNRYFFSVGDAILRNDGYIDKYMGDGIMALFGLEDENPVRVCRQAVRAGLQMLEAIGKLNRYLREQFNIEFRMGIGIHYGEVIVGHTGHPKKKQFTALGDTVNAASRIESATKSIGADLLVSDAIRDALESQLKIGRALDVQLKGKSGTHTLYEVLGLVERRARSRETTCQQLRGSMLEAMPLQLAPALLRLAFHDALAFDAERGIGGANGSIRLPQERSALSRTLQPALNWLGSQREPLGNLSWADLIALGGAVAVELTGGPVIDVPLGREDCDQPSPHDPIPNQETSIEELKARFTALGFTVRELVALSGAHTLGMANGLPITDDFLIFNNSYFRVLLEHAVTPNASLPRTDRLLMEDLECRRCVHEYAFDLESFFRDFAVGYRKLTVLGTSLK